MELKSEFLVVAQKVLLKEKRPMHPREIVSVALRDSLFSDKRSGKTPYQTMKSKLSTHIRKSGDKSIFVRTEPGVFFLRHLLDPKQPVYEAPQLQKTESRERVLVFESCWIGKEKRFQGINTSHRKFCKFLLQPTVFQYMDRLTAEESNDYKQIITYVMVTRRGSILSFKRGNFNRAEDYLRGLLCIGFGGHVTENDLDIFDAKDFGIKQNAARELSEELDLPEIDVKRLQNGNDLKLIGILNDDSSILGQRHLAFLFQYEVSDSVKWNNPKRGEKSITQLCWLNPTSKSVPIMDYEYWSQLCLRQFFPDIIRTAPTYKIQRKKSFKKPHLLCVLGALGSGKSETTKVLCSKYGYSEINSGKVIAEILKVPPVPEFPREVLQKRAWEFIKAPNGPTRLANTILNQAASLKNPRILIDGVRQKKTIEKLIENTGNTSIYLLYVHTPPDLAYKFYSEREKPNLSIFDFLDLRNSPVESEVQDMIGKCDIILYNWTGRGEYQRTIDSLMTELGAG